MNEVYREIEQHIPHLRRYARAMTRNAVAADDLVQECLLRALSKCHLYKSGTNLRAWLFTILHNQHVSDVRRSARTGVSVDPDNAATALATRPTQEAGLMLGAIERALRTLPDQQRVLIEMVALGDLSYEDVAEAQGLPLGTVKSRISRGRSQLREILEGRGHPSTPPYPEGRTRGALKLAVSNLRAADVEGEREEAPRRSYRKAA